MEPTVLEPTALEPETITLTEGTLVDLTTETVAPDPVVDSLAPLAAGDLTIGALTWIALAILRMVLGKRFPGTRHLLPYLAVVLAVFIYAVQAYAAPFILNAPDLSGLDWPALILRGVVCGATTVGAHSAWRELMKAALPFMAPPEEEERERDGTGEESS